MDSDHGKTGYAGGRFGAYELHDLVVLDQHTVGVIVEISKEACKVCSALRAFLQCGAASFYLGSGSYLE